MDEDSENLGVIQWLAPCRVDEEVDAIDCHRVNVLGVAAFQVERKGCEEWCGEHQFYDLPFDSFHLLIPLCGGEGFV
jgi:hypothetical protein